MNIKGFWGLFWIKELFYREDKTSTQEVIPLKDKTSTQELIHLANHIPTASIHVNRLVHVKFMTIRAANIIRLNFIYIGATFI